MPGRVSYAVISRNDCQNQWSFLVSHFPEVEARERTGGGRIEGPVVLVQPGNGRYVHGLSPLSTFEHPEDCTYYFGRDDRFVTEEEVEAMDVVASVYIDIDGHEDMFSWVAAAIVLWDRRVKRG